jgi:hypothetical protein
VPDGEPARRVVPRPLERHRERGAELVGLVERVGVEERLARDAMVMSVVSRAIERSCPSR